MKKLLLIGGGMLAVLTLGVVAAASMQPDTTLIERSVLVAAAPSDVFPYTNNFDLWLKWSPWQDIDPTQKTTFSASKEGAGAWYTWDGNDDVGRGKMTILESVAPTRVVEDLEFFEPFEAKAKVTFTLKPEGEGTKVTWAYESQDNFMAKTMGLFMDMDAMLGADFEKGLGRLKPLAEGAAASRIAAEVAAKAAADQAAAEAAAAATALADAAVGPAGGPPR